MSEEMQADTPEVLLRGALHDLRREAGAMQDEEVVRWAEALSERVQSRRLLVAVLGEHNRGKSTLINSLIGRAWLPVGQSTLPLPPIYVAGGAREQVEIVYDDGSAAESTREELLYQTADDAASISYARVTLPSPDLYGVVLADTPGLNDPDTTRVTQTVYGLLPHSDLALLVLDSTQALGASEYALIEQHIARAGLHRLVVVLNRDDDLENEAQRTAVHERVARLLAPLFGRAPTVLPYAARTALRARERADTRLLARSGYPELRRLLQESAAERTQILHRLVASRAMAAALSLRTRAATPAPIPPPTSVPAPALPAIVTARRALDTLREQYVVSVREFTLGLRERLAEDVAESSPEDMRRFLPFYIRDQFATFLREGEAQALAQTREAVRAADLAETALPLELAGRPIAPGLHPYVAPDFLEDSILITTFMQVLGLVIPSALMTALMTIGPILRRYTHTIRTQDEHNALLHAAQAATLDTGTAIEHHIQTAFGRLDETLRLAALPRPSVTVEELQPDRAQTLQRLDTLVHTLVQLGAAADAGAAARRDKLRE
jgi:predicted GTPase